MSSASAISSSGGVCAAVAAAPLSGWRRLLKDGLLVGGSTAICQALAIVGSLTLRAILDPTQMGVWQGLKMLLGYANYANLGVSKAAARELTLALGRGDPKSADRGLNLAFTVNTATSLIYAAVLAGCGVWRLNGPETTVSRAWSVGLFALALLVILQRNLTFHVTIMRSRQAFAVTSRLDVLDGVLSLSLVTAATWLWGLVGLYGATAFVMLIGMTYLRCNGGSRLHWAWDRAEVVRLIGIGAPILVWGLLSTLLQSLDKWLILACLPDGAFQLGCYSAALLVSAQIVGLGNMFAILFGPRYGELYGRAGEPRPVANLAMQACQIQALGLALMSGLAMLLAPPILARLLPDYEPGLQVIAWLAPGAVAMSLSMPASQYLVAVCRERRLIGPLVAGLAFAAGGSALAIFNGLGIRGVAWATSLSYAVYCGSMIRIALWRDLGPVERRLLASGLAVALGPTMLLAWALSCFAPTISLDSSLPIKCGAVLLVWSLTAWVVWRANGWGTLRRREQP